MRRIITVLGLAWAAKKLFADDQDTETKDIADATPETDKAEA